MHGTTQGEFGIIKFNMNLELDENFALPTIVEKLQDDAKKIGGDNSYQINIGV